MGEHAEDPRFAAFYGLLVTEWRLGEKLDQELEATAGISLNFLELLIHLQWTDGRKRMSELAELLLLSRGGATRLVARMEQEGLVEREIPKDDRRATYARITGKGLKAFEEAMPLHLTAVEETFSRFITDDQAEAMREAHARVLLGIGMECAPVTDAYLEPQ